MKSGKEYPMYTLLLVLLLLLTIAYPETLTSLTKWIADFKDEMKIVFVGDTIQKGSVSPAAPTLWQ